MFHVILFQPEIPPNTGNIIRLCANSGCHLHLIEPIGFELDDKRLRRAGLDYHEYATLKRHADLPSCLESLGQPRLFAFTTKASHPYHETAFQPGDAFLFGPESRGLPAEVLDSLVTRGSFPALMLSPVNFDALYAQEMQRMQEAGEAPSLQ